jgi:hypothetical protein
VAGTDLPPPLPPETRTVGQLVAESIRFYQHRFWQVLPLGLALAVLDQVALEESQTGQRVVYMLGAPLLTAAFVRASSLMSGARWSWPALLAGTLAFLPAAALHGWFEFAAVAWLALVGLAVPAAVNERLGFRDALRRGMELGRTDYVHALGSLATLAIVVRLMENVLILLLKGQADVALRTAIVLGDVVLSPLLFVGAALLYYDQAARHRPRSRDADLHPALEAVDPGRADPEVEPRPAAGGQP